VLYENQIEDYMEIREIKEMPNYSEIVALINAEWPSKFSDKTDDEKIAEMEKSHNLKTDTIKYLYDKDKVVGFYRCSIWPREDINSKIAHTLDIAILPSRQKEGLGTLLMTDMIKDCKQKGISKLLSRSFYNNKGSIRLHKSLGFSIHLETEDSIVWEIEP